MATTINLANVSMAVDFSKLTKGVFDAKADINKLKNMLNDAVTSQEKYARELDILEKAYLSGAISGEKYSQMLEHVARKYGIETSAARALREEQERLLATEKQLMRQQQIDDHMRKMRHNSFMMEYEERKRLAEQAKANSLQGMVSGFTKNQLGSFMVAGGVTMAANRVVGTFVSEAKAIDEIADKAQSLGMTYNDLIISQRYLAEKSGLDAESIAGSFRKFQINIVKAKEGNNDLGKQLKSMGLDAKKLAEMKPMQAFKEIAREFQTLPNAAEKTALAMDLFGKSGAQLTSALDAGAVSLEKMEAHLEASGMLIDEKLVQQVGFMNDQFDRMGDVINGKVRQSVVAVADEVGGMVFIFNTFMKSLPGAAKSAIDLQYSYLLTRATGGINLVAGMIGRDQAAADAPRLERVAELQQEMADLQDEFKNAKSDLPKALVEGSVEAYKMITKQNNIEKERIEHMRKLEDIRRELERLNGKDIAGFKKAR